MRSAIFAQFLAEQEAHPGAIYSKLRDLAVNSARQYLSEPEELVQIACPACGATNASDAFERCGFCYRECTTCGTLYISPRPTTQAFDWYLFESPLAEFRASDVRPAETKGYTNELVQSRSDWIASLCRWTGLSRSAPVVLFQERHRELVQSVSEQLRAAVFAVTPVWRTQPTTKNEAFSRASSLGELNGLGAQLVVAFDCLEQLPDVGQFVVDSWNALAPGGLLALTTRAGSGFDIQALWDRLDTIFPLEHMNLVSVEGMRLLMDNHGFEMVEMSTPGQLDVQVVTRLLNAQEEWRPEDRLIRQLVMRADESARTELQQYLQRHLLSSHMRVVARRRIETE
jgi:hypothetical protein